MGGGLRTFYKKDEVLFKSENEKGFGIFFAVNEFEISDEQLEEERKKITDPDKARSLTKRNNRFCTKLRYTYGDLDIAKNGDGTSREERQKRKEVLHKALLEKC